MRVKIEDLYREAFEMTVRLCKERLVNDIVALYVVGSYLRGDFIPGWSDIDFIPVVKDNVWADEKLRKEFFRKCDLIREETLRIYPDVDIGICARIATTSESIAKKPCLASFLLKRESKLIFGRDVYGDVPSISRRELQQMGKAATLWLCNHVYNNIKNSENQKGKLEDQNLSDLANTAKEASYYVMKIAQNALLIKGIVKFHKKEVVKTFEENCRDFELKNFVYDAYQVQITWLKTRKDKARLTRFINQTSSFAETLKKYLCLV